MGLCSNGTRSQGPEAAELAEQLVWNLQTWPLDLVDWDTVNSGRLDIEINPEEDRDLKVRPSQRLSYLSRRGGVDGHSGVVSCTVVGACSLTRSRSGSCRQTNGRSFDGTPTRTSSMTVRVVGRLCLHWLVTPRSV